LGSLIGRNKMIPAVSPAKTWQGFAGAIMFSTSAAMGMVHLWGDDQLGGMSLAHAVVLGPVLAVGGVLG
ncbi:MAG TPA: hypothetical protein DCO70_02855, partial [Verrucomicrobiales bacterium]|nr:hypothetical protein [Verrucomicrobiales bacterium]